MPINPHCTGRSYKLSTHSGSNLTSTHIWKHVIPTCWHKILRRYEKWKLHPQHCESSQEMWIPFFEILDFFPQELEWGPRWGMLCLYVMDCIHPSFCHSSCWLPLSTFYYDRNISPLAKSPLLTFWEKRHSSLWLNYSSKLNGQTSCPCTRTLNTVIFIYVPIRKSSKSLIPIACATGPLS
jgi:hypothetical protein